MTTPTPVGTATTANSTSTSYTCNKPTGVVENDLMLSLQFANSTGGIGSITSGWTQLQTSTTGMTSRVGMKVAGPAEGANYTLAQGSGADGGAIIIALRGILLGSTPVSAFVSGTTGSNVTTPSVTPGGLDDIEVRFAAGVNIFQFTAPAGMTLQASVASGGFVAGGCATRTLSSGAATGAIAFPASSAPSNPHGYTVTIRGAVGASGRRLLTATFASVQGSNF